MHKFELTVTLLSDKQEFVGGNVWQRHGAKFGGCHLKRRHLWLVPKRHVDFLTASYLCPVFSGIQPYDEYKVRVSVQEFMVYYLVNYFSLLIIT
jgi:hypothetical protein